MTASRGYPLVPLMALIIGINLLAQTGCGITSDYLGRSYAPTTQVNIYYNAAEIQRSYSVMGTARLEAGSSTPVPEFEAELVRLGMAHGADAVLIEDLEFVVVGTTEDFTTERFGRDDRWVSGSSRTRVNRNKVLTAQLLRYTGGAGQADRTDAPGNP